GRAGMTENGGLQPPPDNSFDRRADFSAAHKARKSTSKPAQGFGEAPQRDYGASPITGLDPQLEKELGLDANEAEFPSPLRGGVGGGGDADSAPPLPNPPPQGGREQSESAARSEKYKESKYRLPKADLPTQPGGFGGMASQQSLERLLREG